METINKLNKQITTPQQELFSQNVSMGKNQSESYRIAYPKSLKWKESTVWERASVLMRNNKVITRIGELRESNAKRNEMTLNKVLQNMAEWLEFDPIDLVDESECVKSLKDLDPKVRKSLSKIEVVEIFAGSGEKRSKIGELKKITFHDKVKVADMFMKCFNAYNSKSKYEENDLSHLRDILDQIK